MNYSRAFEDYLAILARIKWHHVSSKQVVTLTTTHDPNTSFHLSNWRDIILSFIYFSFRVRISGFLKVTVSFNASSMVRISSMIRISFLVGERVSIRDFGIRCVDKMTSCQFGCWKQVLTYTREIRISDTIFSYQSPDKISVGSHLKFSLFSFLGFLFRLSRRRRKSPRNNLSCFY